MRRGALVLTLLAAAQVAVPVALQAAGHPDAYAAQRALEDPRGDVWRVSAGSAEPTRTRGADQDLRGGLLRHGATTVTVRWRYAALRPQGRLVVHRAMLRDRTGTTWEARVDAGPGSREGRAHVFTDDDRLVPCATEHRIDVSRRTVTLRVPRSCLGDPTALQGRLDTFRGDADGSFRRDNLHDRSAQTARWTRMLTSG